MPDLYWFKAAEGTSPGLETLKQHHPGADHPYIEILPSRNNRDLVRIATSDWNGTTVNPHDMTSTGIEVAISDGLSRAIGPRITDVVDFTTDNPAVRSALDALRMRYNVEEVSLVSKPS